MLVREIEFDVNKDGCPGNGSGVSSQVMHKGDIRFLSKLYSIIDKLFSSVYVFILFHSVFTICLVSVSWSACCDGAS